MQVAIPAENTLYNHKLQVLELLLAHEVIIQGLPKIMGFVASFSHFAHDHINREHSVLCSWK